SRKGAEVTRCDASESTRAPPLPPPTANLRPRSAGHTPRGPAELPRYNLSHAWLPSSLASLATADMLRTWAMRPCGRHERRELRSRDDHACVLTLGHVDVSVEETIHHCAYESLERHGVRTRVEAIYR